MKYPNLIFFASIALLGACGSDPVPPPQAPPPAPPVAEAPPPPPAPAQVDDQPNKSNINISDEIRRLCGISDAEAHFAFDSANVRDTDRAVLKKLADCFATGPLKGRRMNLVGHADPRGDDEYNRVLGQKRADNVGNVISQLGLSNSMIATTSRGEDEARGTDEGTWAQDRRVDVVLAN
ncbi:MAG TPA: OmpA family protein [Polyangiaceae bacterium]